MSVSNFLFVKYLSQTLLLVKFQKCRYQKPKHKIMFLFLLHSYKLNIQMDYIHISQSEACPWFESRDQVPGPKTGKQGLGLAPVEVNTGSAFEFNRGALGPVFLNTRG